MLVFYRRHVCRVDPWPESVTRSFDKIGRSRGLSHHERAERVPRHRHAQGLDITARLGEIRVPTLIISGRYDEATPAISRRSTRVSPAPSG